jgi:hypothetical protein
MALDERSPDGSGRGGGIENTLDALSKAPPGDTLRDAMVAFVVADVVLERPRS